MAESSVSERSPAELVELYIKLRDAKEAAAEEYKKSMERTNLGMQKLEAILLDRLQVLEVDSLTAKGIGTVYRNTQYSATVQDAREFKAFLDSSGDWELADIRANKTAVRAALAAGKSVPGVNFTTNHTVGIRRSS